MAVTCPNFAFRRDEEKLMALVEVFKHFLNLYFMPVSNLSSDELTYKQKHLCFIGF